MKSRLIQWAVTILFVALPVTAVAQSSEKAEEKAKPAEEKDKKAKKEKKAKSKKAEETAEPSKDDKIAQLEAAQKALEEQLSDLQAKVTASAEQSDKQSVDELSQQVKALDEKVEAKSKESQEKDEAIQQELDALAPAAGWKIKGPGDSFLKVGGLLQARIESTKDAAPDKESWDWDSYLRRMRIMVYGQLNKWVNFFIETDNPNFGKGGKWTFEDKASAPSFIQDAYLEINVHEAFQFDIGMLLVPFSHHGMQGATSLMAMDYHSKLIKYPRGSHHVWRDAGFMVRGLFARKHVEYRLGLFNGVHGNANDPRNPKDLPRLTARLTFNVWDAEGGPGVGGMFYDGIYLKNDNGRIVSPKKILSFGTSLDWQPDLNVTYATPPQPIAENHEWEVKDRKDYLATNFDVFWDIPLGSEKIMSLTGQVNFYFYNHGTRESDIVGALDNTTGQNVSLPSDFSYYNTIGDSAMYSGLGMSSELGFRYNWFQPVFAVDYYNAIESALDIPADDPNADPNAASASEIYCNTLGVGACTKNPGDYIAVYGGFNVFLFGHSTTLKLQIGADRANNADDWTPSTKFQAQLVF